VIIENLNRAFANTQNSYKYYWWLSINELCHTEKIQKIAFEDIVLKILSKLWYPVNYFKLSFGKLDRCSRYVKQIQIDYNIEDDVSEKELYQFLLDNKSSVLLKKITAELTRYVPYRFIRPWFNEETHGLLDSKVNNALLALQNDSCPYIINREQKKIEINSDSYNWIISNYSMTKAFTYFELVKYLEKENPNVSGITKKIDKPVSRNLSIARKYWKNFITQSPNQLDVFEGTPLGNINHFSLDHFLPWSFVTHDLLWNLHPVDRIINSSKSNKIPSLVYLESFGVVQYKFCNYLLKGNHGKPLEDYYSLFKCSQDELLNISQQHFSEKLKSFYLPQFEVSRNMGFDQNWSVL